MINLQILAKLIRENKSFILGTHQNPDGDGIGSLLGLGAILKKMKKDVLMCWGDDQEVPAQYRTLPFLNEVKNYRKAPENPEVFIALDCADKNRLGKLEKKATQAENLIVIDHHVQKEHFGNLNFIDEKASSTSEIIFFLAKELNLELDYETSFNLYVGLVTDTGKFQYSNTSIKTLEVAVELIKNGVSPVKVFREVYENTSMDLLKLLGLVLERITLKEGIGYSIIRQNDFKGLTISNGETENFIDFLRSIAEVRLAILFREMPGGDFKVSLRSKDDINCVEIARKFKGGGHKAAAGFRSNKSIDEILNLIERYLGKK